MAMDQELAISYVPRIAIGEGVALVIRPGDLLVSRSSDSRDHVRMSIVTCQIARFPRTLLAALRELKLPIHCKRIALSALPYVVTMNDCEPVDPYFHDDLREARRSYLNAIIRRWRERGTTT